MALALFPQSLGDAGIAQTLSKMASLTNASFLDPAIRDQAAYAISACNRETSCQCAALLSWVSRVMRYVKDPAGVELLHDPRLIARAVYHKKLVYGDCDDMSMYLAALLKAVGLRPTFKAVGYDRRPYQHVYVVCNGITLDPTRSAWGRAGYSYPRMETSVMERAV